MIVAISNTPRDYAWGSPTLIADLEGREPSGAPEAEIWFGDHPGSPSAVHDGTDRTLDAWLPAAAAAHDELPAKLPYLLKLLAAGAPLSIQVHPSKEQAVEGFAREEAAGVPRDAGSRNYKDDNHKPEVIVALSETFTALAGLRDIVRTRALVDALGDAPAVRTLRAHLATDDAAAALRRTIGWLLGEADAAEIAQIVDAAASTDSAEFAAELELTRSLHTAYPSDPGIVVALLMNLVELRRGEAIFVPAGVLHAYVAGLGVEIMAASDNVLRGGLTPKHIDVAELLALVDFRPAEPPYLRATPAGEGAEVFAPGIADFALGRLGAGEAANLELNGISIALGVAGSATVTGASGAAVTLAPGQAALITPEESPLTSDGAGEVFVAMPGA
ncbi:MULTISPECIES: mannose-6-phosphate isomerase, class I [Microbacterium]|uniref:mannose-6-phosphate isomerase, class I n=1 Tax=Microbacterium TaxID=33882 RepID=UPI002786D208|nr:MULTISPECIES: mannose-6-phosphate isomerase, class I [Microbacterium]MDQ1083278.1 mannose-6-phosphate isomerase [Microbacterium sp. SORGH_AS_0344]MDQ1171443.1 mannose-6-phosphate isomerase [Microbacterium proteolyticum]